MKRIFAIGFLAAGLLACSHQREAELDAREAKLNEQEHIQDSIRIVQSTKDHVAASPGQSTTASNSTAAPAEEKKKGLNNKAKGAIIGAGVGAITGAVIDKNHRGRGAIIGGVVGAGAGLGTGAIIDKKKEEQQTTNN